MWGKKHRLGQDFILYFLQIITYLNETEYQ